jgi:hypothetical protein
MATARNFDPKNIIVGAATFYVGPQGVELTKINVSTATDTAQDPTKMDTAASWNHLGYTQNGVTMNIEPTYGEVVVDQLLDVARLFKSSQRVMVATSLTETTLENLYVAIGSKKSDLTVSGAASLVYNNDAGSNVTTTASNHISGAASAGTVAAALDLNGGALGYTPIERSVCFVGPAPSNVVGATGKAERIYVGYRATSMDAVGVAVQRDNATLFPVNFRLLPSQANEAADGNAAYGKIVDRVY